MEWERGFQQEEGEEGAELGSGEVNDLPSGADMFADADWPRKLDVPLDLGRYAGPERWLWPCQRMYLDLVVTEERVEGKRGGLDCVLRIADNSCRRVEGLFGRRGVHCRRRYAQDGWMPT